MQGNAIERCSDSCQDYPAVSPADDKPATAAVSDLCDNGRLIRGGHESSPPKYIRSAARNSNRPMTRYVSFGLRPVSTYL